ncbi:MAG: Stp1/IreP family PP2C-type Ser/Thr phosphatase [Oligoflexia bacterium]|nr:Stp1/IreP family PP2C-type Ser/Thr phosphatase [Oligoflexia bacterium]
MQMKVVGQTDVGLKRENNQDHILVDPALGLYIVADGMGGHLGGEVASRLATVTIQEVIKKSWETESGVSPYDLLQRAYMAASKAIYDKALENPKLKGMGTTAVAALVRENKIYFANVGDSRTYLIHPPHIWQLTEDHSLLNEQIRAGLIKAENIPVFAAKNVITRSVGFEDRVTCDVIERDVTDGDYYVMCSDGLSGLVPDRRICDVCLTLPFDEVTPRLIEEAKRNGGDDNISVVLMHVVKS